MIELIIIIFIPILIFYLANQLNKTEKSVNLPEQFKNLPEKFKNLTPKSVIFIPTFIAIIAQFFIKYENIAVTIGIFCILIATIALFKYYNEMKTKNSAYKGIIPIGIALGILAVTRQDMISYMWGLFFWAMFWAGMADVEGLALSLKNRAIKGAKQGIFLTAIIIISSIFIVIFINLIEISSIFPEQFINLITISSSSTEQFNNLTEKTNISTSIFNDLRIIIQNIIKYFSKYSTINLPKPTTIYGVLFYFPPISAIFSLISLIFLNRKQIIKANTPLFWKEMLIINLTLNIFNYTLTGNTLSTILPSILFATLTIFNIKKAILTLINQNKTGKSGNLTP